MTLTKDNVFYIQEEGSFHTDDNSIVARLAENVYGQYVSSDTMVSRDPIAHGICFI